jgi:hypothetical protein
MNPKRTRQTASLLAAALFLTAPAFSFDSPLSSESVREAYFLGQRHDASFLGKYIKFLPPPKSGPYISSVTFLTPFAQLVQFCDRYVGNYTAQQAMLDRRGQEELVKVIVEIQLTNSYGAFLTDASNLRPGSFPGLVRRPFDFWKDFQVQVFNGNQTLTSFRSRGNTHSSCGRRGPCTLTGASLEFEFPADVFTSDSANIQVLPPEGEPVSADFDLTHLR